MHKIITTVTMLFVFTTLLSFDLYGAGNKPHARKVASGTNIVSNEIKPSKIEDDFLTPPDDARFGMFWDWLGGQISRYGITKDLEAMTAQGIGKVLVMVMPDQLVVSTPWRFSDYPGKVKVLSDEWFAMVHFAISECDRLGMDFNIFISPGWSHVGGPWVDAAHSLKILRNHDYVVTGPALFSVNPDKSATIIYEDDKQTLGKPSQEFPYNKDIAMLAFRKPVSGKAVNIEEVIDITAHMHADGKRSFEVPSGDWTIRRIYLTGPSGTNKPPPKEGLGSECDRMDPEAVRIVYDNMVGRIKREADAAGLTSLKAFETDSYEAGFQDYTPDFAEVFKASRGYDCTPRLISWNTDTIFNSVEETARFKYDMLLTCADLTAERFHGELRRLAEQNGLLWMNEPYHKENMDWRRTAWLSHQPGGEFWVKRNGGGGMSLGPAPDIATLRGGGMVWAEAFTSQAYDSAWTFSPGKLKQSADQAFLRGINQFFMHGFPLNPFADNLRPGLSMGNWGTHFSRHQTWWGYAKPWHAYLARCGIMLRTGHPVADVLMYPSRGRFEKRPEVSYDMERVKPYRATILNDAQFLTKLRVDNGDIILPHGARYRALGLTPNVAVTPSALTAIARLVNEGATLIGTPPPAHSPSLTNYPSCDAKIKNLITSLWGVKPPAKGEHQYGAGRVIWGRKEPAMLKDVCGLPRAMFTNFKPGNKKNVQFTHQKDGDTDIFFVVNGANTSLECDASFRVSTGTPELWDPVTGAKSALPKWRKEDDRTVLGLRLSPFQSYFIVFGRERKSPAHISGRNFLDLKRDLNIDGPWEVAFDSWALGRDGKPDEKSVTFTFNTLADWTSRSEAGMKYYSGSAVYRKIFDAPKNIDAQTYIDLGEVNNVAQVNINGENIGITWIVPHRLQIPPGVLKGGKNQLEIRVANTWANRMIGDEQEPGDLNFVPSPRPDRGTGYRRDLLGKVMKDLPDWVINNAPRPSKNRRTFTNWGYYDKEAPLLSAGLLGPVTIVSSKK